LSDPIAFEPRALLQALDHHGVRFVVIGGIAANVLGSPTLTRDLDICYARDAGNLKSLAGALGELHARLRGADPGLPFRSDARTLKAGDTFTLQTDAGALDLLGTPAGTGGYADLARSAKRTELGGLTLLVASVDDLIRMKRAAGRAKDLIEVEVLGALRDEIERG
jgi:hypothetical protein